MQYKAMAMMTRIAQIVIRYAPQPSQRPPVKSS